jgi:hypothetical protein
MARFKVLSRHLSGRADENHEGPVRMAGLNPGPSEYETAVLTIRQRRPLLAL